MKALSWLFIVLVLSIGISMGQDAPAPTSVEVAQAEQIQEDGRTNRMLLTVGIAGVVLIGVGALALASYTSHQAAQGIPLPAFVELAKVVLHEGTRFALPIGANLANQTSNTLDDLAIERLAQAHGWTVTRDDAGKLTLTPPAKDAS